METADGDSLLCWIRVLWDHLVRVRVLDESIFIFVGDQISHHPTVMTYFGGYENLGIISTNRFSSLLSSGFHFGRFYLFPTATADFVGFVSSSVARLSSAHSYAVLQRLTTSLRVLHRL